MKRITISTIACILLIIITLIIGKKVSKPIEKHVNTNSTHINVIENNSQSILLDAKIALEEKRLLEEQKAKEEAEAKAREEELQLSSVVYYSGEYTPNDLMYHGEIYWGNYRFTWYSEKVLPGGGLSIPGRYSDGNFVRDVNGYICCASNDLPWGTVVETPWGTACVYDCGCASGTIDIYTSW